MPLRGLDSVFSPYASLERLDWIGEVSLSCSGCTDSTPNEVESPTNRLQLSFLFYFSCATNTNCVYFFYNVAISLVTFLVLGVSDKRITLTERLRVDH